MEGATQKPTTAAALRTENLTLYYGAFEGLKNIDFQVYKNSITSLIGPSGCGKSTLLRCFNRMNDLIDGVRIEGTILIHDTPIGDIDIIDLRRRVGMVFQRPNPFPFTIYENMVYGLAIHGLKRKGAIEIVERCLRSVGLWDDLKDKMRTPALLLSDETKQRLCIARLLTIEPEIILLDEPCSALDPIATMHVEELMLELKRDYTILIVTHNMQQAARVSDYTGFMLLGDLVEFGKTEQIFTSPQQEKTEEYITGRFG
jgi:phosphate transport system ATP-binding protein